MSLERSVVGSSVKCFNIKFIESRIKVNPNYYNAWTCDIINKIAMFDESTKLCDIKYKIVFLGQSAVGKSAIIERFIQQRFD